MKKKTVLPDMQNRPDKRGVAINWVGIFDYRIPFRVRTKGGGSQPTIGRIDIDCNLSAKTKGANMSRFSQVIEKALEKKLLDIDLVKDMLRACQKRLEADNSRITIYFPYFLTKKAPVSKKVSHSHYDCAFKGQMRNNKLKLFLEAKIHYTSCCPCSKEMSLTKKGSNLGCGAHNQRSVATVKLRFRNLTKFVWIEDIVKIIEKASSCPIWNTLKRPDEKYVTERAYKNPKFTEDVVRDVSLMLDKLHEIDYYKVTVEHEESIHQSNARAEIEKTTTNGV